MTAPGHPLRIESLALDAAHATWGRASREPRCYAIHEATLARLRDALTDPDRPAGDFLLSGPRGVGKSILLRRLYWDVFANDDDTAPILCALPDLPFDPVRWAGRFAVDAARQWAAWERGDAQMTARESGRTQDLESICAESGLHALADFARRATQPLAWGSDGAEAVLAAFRELAGAAEQAGRRLAVMIDEPWRGRWTESDETLTLARVAAAQSPETALCRLWSSRHDARQAHPLLAPGIDPVEEFSLAGLGDEEALALVSRLTRERNTRCDASVLRDFLYLWNGIPAWLAHFAAQAAQTPRDIDSEELLVDAYVADVAHGATARLLQRELQGPNSPQAPGPEEIARAAETGLLWPDTEDARGARPLGRGANPQALERIALAALADYSPRGWSVASTPTLADFLRLYVTRYYYGRNTTRNEVALKRHRLVERATREAMGDGAQADRRQAAIFLHAMRGQSVPRKHFQAHLRTTAGDRPDPTEGIDRAVWMDLPHALGVFDEDAAPASRGKASLPPAVVAWCFDEPGYYRTDEAVWAVYVCPASVVTSDEIDEVARSVRRLGRELNVGRITAWVVGNGRYSPEAAQRVGESPDLLASTWDDFQALCETVMPAPSARTQERAGRPAQATPRREARVVRGAEGDALGEKVVELFLPPVADMELTAAQSVEHLARDAGYTDEAVGEIRMATLEACLNAIERCANSEKEVYVRLAASSDRLSVEVCNEGETFDPQAVESPSLEGKMQSPYKRGWGLALMKKFMDRVVYEPYDRGTRLRMTKRNRTPDIPRQPLESRANTGRQEGGTGA